MTKPAVVLIGGDKGGVGKTTVARTLLETQICPPRDPCGLEVEDPGMVAGP